MRSDAQRDDALSPDCQMIRDEAGLMVEIEPSMTKVLGWRPDQMIGSPSTAFIHPDDQPSAVAAWFDMITAPGSTRTWRGRYRAADGSWRWVETVNINRLDDPERPCVSTVMRRVAGGEASVEEELRARKQLLSRLADALPVGLFEIDAQRRVVFTNDRLHVLVGTPSEATVEAQFASVIAEDRPLLESALATVLANAPVDDIELRLKPSAAGTEESRVCQVAMRALTDGTGAVSGAIGCLTDVTDSVLLRRELEIRASIDELTGCLNRAATIELLGIMLRQQEHDGAGLAVVFFDLDRFKQVNDRLGHAAGDALLIEASRRMRAALRSGDRLGRLGGDEFLVICPSVADPEQALEVARRLARTIDATVDIDGTPVVLRASFGVAWTAAERSPDALIARADAAMYESKLDGRGSVVLAA